MLSAELAAMRREGLTLPVWWRDDDAIAPTPALDRLATMASDLGLAVHLAVIPKTATPALAEAVAGRPSLVPLVHGWAHANHAPVDAKKAEFGPHRPLEDRQDEARHGLQRLRDLFGPRLCPVFVPPWNRIAPDMGAGLSAVGYRALSGFGPRDAALAAPGLAQINTHLDPIDWHRGRSLADPDTLLTGLAASLANRREGRADATEPLGLLTHHLVHDAAIWDFSRRVLATLLDGGARQVTLTPETFG